jgi:glycosyltransferase involved in cell wall biosynthesis
MTLRVLFLVNSLCVGGAEKHVVSLVNGLDPARHRLALTALKRDEALLPQIAPHRLPDGLSCLDVAQGLSWHAVHRLARQLDAQRTDVLVCTNMYALLYGWLARALCRRGAKVRLVEVFHSTLPESRKEARHMVLYRHLVRRADLLVFVCQAQADHWHVHGLRARQDVVIHNGIDTARFRDTWSPEDKRRLRSQQGFSETDLVVGLCGVMRPEKAHGDFLRALAQTANSAHTEYTSRTAQTASTPDLAGQKQRVCGWLIGDGPLRAALERDIDALGLRERVRISGFVQDVRPLVAACDAMAITSTTETFSLAALEAMALGKPLLMTDVGGARVQVRHGDNGWLVPVGDVNAMAGALARWQDPAAREAMGQRAAAQVREHFELAGMVQGFERQFSALV